jgi:hypothetical protein
VLRERQLTVDVPAHPSILAQINLFDLLRLCNGPSSNTQHQCFNVALRTQEERNGFTFDGTDHGSLHGALDRAINLYKGQFDRWNEYSLRNMKVGATCLCRPSKHMIPTGWKVMPRAAVCNLCHVLLPGKCLCWLHCISCTPYGYL